MGAVTTLIPAPREPVSGEIVGPGDLAPIETVAPSRNPALVYLAGLQRGDSQRTMRRALDTIAELLTGGQMNHQTLPWHLLRYEHTSAAASRIIAGYAPATANKILSALGRVITTAWRLGYYDAEARDRIASFDRPKGSGPTAAEVGRHLSTGELRAMFADCRGTVGTLGARDAALLAVLYGGGLRRAESVAVDLDDWDEVEGKLLVHGKRRKDRTVYLSATSMQAVSDWLDLRGREAGPMFMPVLKSGRLDPQRRRMSAAAVYRTLAVRANRVGVASFSPHDLRRTFVGDLLDAGVDLSTVQKIAGHASSNTTSGYDRRGDRAKKRAAGLLHVPYVGPATKGATDAA